MIGNANHEWLRTLEIVKSKGQECHPRDMPIKEVRHHTTKFQMSYPVVHERTRKLSYTFMAAEALWIMHGSNELDFHHEIRSKLEPYSDDLVHMTGAYGIPFIEQFKYVCDRIYEDRDTRQAVMTLWRPNPSRSKDIPCTVAIQFLVRDDTLHLSVFMRSSDVWMGLPYDMFSFSCMAHLVAQIAATKLGNCCITAGSSHLYMKDYTSAEGVLYSPRHVPEMTELSSFVDIRDFLWSVADSPNQNNALEKLLRWREHAET